MKSKAVSIIELLVIAAAGVILLINPGDSLYTAARILGVALLAYGIFSVIKYLAAREDKSALDIVTGVIAVIFGIVVLTGPQLVISIFPMIAGVVVAIAGLKSLIEAIRTKDTLAIVLAIVTVCLGILIFSDPFSTAVGLARLLGVVLVYIGVTGLIRAARA